VSVAVGAALLAAPKRRADTAIDLIGGGGQVDGILFASPLLLRAERR
jgi:hypothetical protein